MTFGFFGVDLNTSVNSKKYIQATKTTKNDEAVRVRKPVLVLDVTVVVLTVVTVIVVLAVVVVVVVTVEVCTGLLHSSLEIAVGLNPWTPQKYESFLFFQKNAGNKQEKTLGKTETVFNGNEFMEFRLPTTQVFTVWDFWVKCFVFLPQETVWTVGWTESSRWFKPSPNMILQLKVTIFERVTYTYNYPKKVTFARRIARLRMFIPCLFCLFLWWTTRSVNWKLLKTPGKTLGKYS